MKDTRIVRNWQRIKAVQDNVAWVLYQSEKSGGFGQFLADWPTSDQVGLLKVMKKEGARLGGMSAQWLLRFIGKDGFVLSTDVVTALKGTGLDISDTPTSQRDLNKIQAQFNEWHEQTDLPYAYLSKILACSVGENYGAL
jgi:3-methyladenine DNA glycosylase Tag